MVRAERNRETTMKAEKDMRTVKQVSQLSGVSIRTLYHYDSIGLLKPTKTTEAGYRLYDDAALERLQQILLFRELQFSLKEIREILDSSNFDRNQALEQQIALLQLRKEHLENLITFARGIQLIGVRHMDFTAFDTKKIDEYAQQAKAMYDKTEEYQECLERSKSWTKEDEAVMEQEIMDIFVGFGKLRNRKPADSVVQKQVDRLHDYINQHLYNCKPKIMQGLGKMYAGGGSITDNIDQAGGAGTAEFVAEAIAVWCERGEEV